MNAFSKSSRGTSFRDLGSASVDTVDVSRSVVVEEHGNPVTRIERKRVRISDYAESLGLPTSEQYRLREMLKTGYVPEEVNVSGMLDDPDKSDVSVRDSLVDRLFAFESKKVPSPVVEQAAQVASQVVETVKND